jgi:hypothetical protein
MTPPTRRQELLPSEALILAAMQRLRFGRFEFLQIRRGELVLDPWPVTIQDTKFASTANAVSPEVACDELRPQVSEFFSHVRTTIAGEIRKLEFRHGLPFGMEVDLTAGIAAAVSNSGSGSEGYCRG